MFIESCSHTGDGYTDNTTDQASPFYGVYYTMGAFSSKKEQVMFFTDRGEARVCASYYSNPAYGGYSNVIVQNAQDIQGHQLSTANDWL